MLATAGAKRIKQRKSGVFKMSNNTGFKKAAIWCDQRQVALQEQKIKRYGLLQKIHDQCYLDYGAWDTLVLFKNVNRLNLANHKQAKGLRISIEFDFDFTGTTLEAEDYLKFCILDRFGHEAHEKIEVTYDNLPDTYTKSIDLINEVIAAQSANKPAMG